MKQFIECDLLGNEIEVGGLRGRLDPLVKWSGSKRSQAAAILASVKGSYNTYYEPFCGGCSVLFYILNNCPGKFKYYVCSDLNAPLIELYRLVKHSPDDIRRSYRHLWAELNADDNLERKKAYFADGLSKAYRTNDNQFGFTDGHGGIACASIQEVMNAYLEMDMKGTDER